MEFKGTKGKWFYSHRQIPNDPDGMYSTQVYDKHGDTICSLAWHRKPAEERVINGVKKLVYGTDREENALLISKAPEMLEMLKKIYFGNEYKEPSLHMEIKKLIKEAIEL